MWIWTPKRSVSAYIDKRRGCFSNIFRLNLIRAPGSIASAKDCRIVESKDASWNKCKARVKDDGTTLVTVLYNPSLLLNAQSGSRSTIADEKLV